MREKFNGHKVFIQILLAWVVIIFLAYAIVNLFCGGLQCPPPIPGLSG